MQELKRVIDVADYEKGGTLKIVVGTASVTVFLDETNRELLKELTENFTTKTKHSNVSELSLTFPTTAIETKGILSFITRELYLHDIVITEMLTASEELLIYLKEDHILKAYELIKRLQKG